MSYDSDSKYLVVGEIIGSHGLNGEIKIRPYTSDPYDFLDFEKLKVADKELKIRSVRVHKNTVYLYLERVTKRSTVEKLLKQKVYIHRDEEPELEEDEYYIVDLLGAKVIDKTTNEEIGELVDVKQSGMVDNFEIKISNKTILVPALQEYFEIVNTSLIYADFPKEFFEL